MKPQATGDDEPTQRSIDMASLRTRLFGTYAHTYAERDLMLYALGLGCTSADDLRYVYERHPAFAALPTYAIIAAHPSLDLVPLEIYIPGLDRAKALHGEQYLELMAPLPPRSRLLTKPHIVDVQDKGAGKGCVVVLRTVTTDELSGRTLAVNEFTTFVLGAGGFGASTPGPKPPPRPAAATAANEPPPRLPDAVETYRTQPDQAALYRLSGDYNPLHIDPKVAKRVGFDQPILHGLCTLGVSARLLLKRFGGDDPSRMKSIKVRFSKHVLPGETLRVEMWDVGGGKVVFRTWAQERSALAISHAAVELQPAADAPSAGGSKL